MWSREKTDTKVTKFYKFKAALKTVMARQNDGVKQN